MARAFDENHRHLVQAFRRRDLVDRQLDRGLVGCVKDVVDGAREREEVFAVERCRVSVGELIDQDPSLGVTFAFDLFDLFDEVLVRGGLASELLERLQRTDGQVRLVGQQLYEAAVVRPSEGLYRASDAQGATPRSLTAACRVAATTTASGSVSNQLNSSSRTIPHRTEEARCAAPTPTSPPSIV